VHLEPETNFPNFAVVTGFCFKFNFLYNITAKNEGKKTTEKNLCVSKHNDRYNHEKATNLVKGRKPLFPLEAMHASQYAEYSYYLPMLTLYKHL